MTDKIIVKRGENGTIGLAHKKNGNVLLNLGGDNSNIVKHTSGPGNEDEESGKKDWVPWGSDDNFPRTLIPLIRKSTVGRSALQMLTKAVYGQRLFTYRVKGYKDDGQEIIEHVYLEEWEVACRQSNFNAVRLGIIQDHVFFGFSMPELRFNGNKQKIWGFDYHKVANCRFAPKDKFGYIPQVYISANMPNAKPEECQKLPVIDFIRYPDQLEAIKTDYKNMKYVMPQMWPDVINDYYPVVYWDSARSSGQLGIATSIPAYKAALFKNQMSLKYDIQIPWEWVEEMYPGWAQKTPDEQDKIINELYDEIVNCLTGAENAQKAIMSFYRVGKDGKASGQWIIKTIDDKMRNDAYLPDAAASNSEILFAMLVNPATTGQGNTGGSYTGGSNNGGSNIRESLELMRSMLKADRDIIYGFFEFFKMYNGLDMDVRLAVQDTVLTTLDTGSSVAKTTS